MANKANNRKYKIKVKSKKSSQNAYLIAVPTVILIFKLIMMFNIKGGGWYGADGENYLKGVESLVDFGFLSNEPKLNYWPAGYPLLMWPIAEITTVYFFYIISLIQAVFFAYSTYFFTNQLKNGPLKYLAVVTSFFISLNPTLSLSTFSIGYEAPIASCFLMALGLIYKFVYSQESLGDKKTGAICVAFTWLSLASFMQPRFLLVSVLLLGSTLFLVANKTAKLRVACACLALLLVSPSIMIFRNSQAIGQPVISTNLGVTMAIGAGPETSGSYVHKGPEVNCPSGKPLAELKDNAKVTCVVKWYISNPVKALKLAFNKSQYFWSPWSGPLADGTMARNPWLNISPAYTVIKNKDGAELVLGPFGKFVSYLWIIGQMAFLLLGFLKVRSVAKNFALLAVIPILTSWLISIGTIGDHRFRIPTMGLSLFFQAAGILVIKDKITKKL
jgi:hypothetical protein